MTKRLTDGQFSPGGNVKSIGKLSFHRTQVLGVGSYGTVYRGQFEETIDVIAVKRMDKSRLNSDFEIKEFPQIPLHPNVVRFYHFEEDGDFM